MSDTSKSSKPLLVVSVQQLLSQDQRDHLLPMLERHAAEVGAVPMLLEAGATATLQHDIAPLIAVMARVAESVEANTRAVRDLVEQIASGDDGEPMNDEGDLSGESGYLNGR